MLFNSLGKGQGEQDKIRQDRTGQDKTGQGKTTKAKARGLTETKTGTKVKIIVSQTPLLS